MKTEQLDARLKGAGTGREDRREELDDVAQVVEWAIAKYPKTLLFLESAKVSAADSPYRHPVRLAQLLEVLDELVARWQKHKKLGQPWKTALKEKGFEYRERISHISLGKYGDDYNFMYEGRKQLFENHVTIGGKQANNCISVHWLRDEQKRILVIGICGRHGTTTRS